jgi:hypothetical protein
MYSVPVSSSGQRLIEFYRRLPPTATPLILIVLVVLIGNITLVTGLSNNDPIAWTSAISHELCRISCGRTIDPNVGAITQSLGHRAALDVIHGHLPWWNSLEGLGTPLAGEMQSAALFPLTWLLAAPGGLVWMHIILEAIAGTTTFLFLRRLSVPVAFATMGGMLFALDGTFAWLANTVVNPLAFLPMLLLGVEIILDRSSDNTRRGLTVAAVALALSLYSGFPEGAYFDALFCGVWAIIRLFSLSPDRRVRALRRLAIAAVIGVGLALPTLVPFYDFVKVAYLGGHTSAIDGSASMPKMAIRALFNPYVYGLIFDNPNASHVWDTIGGYFTVSVSALGIVGLFGSRLRALRIFLAAWIIIAMAGSFDFFHLRALWNLIPLVDTSAFARYIISSCEMALIILAVLGIADLATRQRSRVYLAGSSIFMALVLLWCTLTAQSYNRGVAHHAHVRYLIIALGLIPFVAIGIIIVVSLLKRRWWSMYLVAAVLVGESLVMFMIPTVSAPKEINVDYAPINYLLQHQGEERFVDLGVLFPNWGSQFGLNEFSMIDLPFPRAFKNYIQTSLYPGLKPAQEFLVTGGLVGTIKWENELVEHFEAYENASVKYLLAPAALVLLPQLTALGVKPVWRDSLATIYSLPNPRAFFSSSTCTVVSTNVEQANVTCTTAHSTLLRTELAMKGWTATVNGRPAQLHTIDDVYQEISVPRGTSTVRYSFSPPHEVYAGVAGVLAALLLIGSFTFDVRRQPLRRRRRPPVV